MKRLLPIWSFVILSFLWIPLMFVFKKGANLTAFSALLGRSDLLSAFLQSLLLAIATCVIATTLATVTAFGLPLLKERQLKFVEASLILPMILPEVVFGLAYLVWFLKMGLPLGWTTLILGHVAFSFGYSVFVMKVVVEKIDWFRVDAARDLGANRWQVFRHAFFPQLAPGFAASGLMVFSLSLDDYFISSFLKSLDQMTLPIQIFSMMRVRIGPEVYAMAVILFVLSLVTVITSQLWLKESKA
jgi:spermidine/putrescine transport system permease protein